jgi:hypothetical protein
MPFLQLPQLTPIDESGEFVLWITCAPFSFESIRFFPGKKYEVPAGYKTNLASIPRLVPGSGWYLGRANAASCLHDYLYEYGMKLKIIENRAEADMLLLEAMLDTGVPNSIAYQMYYKVTYYGEPNFNP